MRKIVIFDIFLILLIAIGGIITIISGEYTPFGYICVWLVAIINGINIALRDYEDDYWDNEDKIK